MAHTFPRMINPNIRVFWAGFQSTTHELGRVGWRVEAYQQPEMRRLQLAFINKPLGLVGLSQMEEFDYMRYHAPQSGYVDIQQMEIKCHMIPKEAQIAVSHTMEGMFHAVNTEPDMVTSSVKSIEDLFLFQPKKEILVEPSTIPEMMELILKQQSPKQKEIREKYRKTTKREIHKEEQKLIYTPHFEVASMVET